MHNKISVSLQINDINSNKLYGVMTKNITVRIHTCDEAESFISRLYKAISNLVYHESARCHYKAIDLRLPRQMIILNLM